MELNEYIDIKSITPLYKSIVLKYNEIFQSSKSLLQTTLYSFIHNIEMISQKR